MSGRTSNFQQMSNVLKTHYLTESQVMSTVWTSLWTGWSMSSNCKGKRSLALFRCHLFSLACGYFFGVFSLCGMKSCRLRECCNESWLRKMILEESCTWFDVCCFLLQYSKIWVLYLLMYCHQTFEWQVSNPLYRAQWRFWFLCTNKNSQYSQTQCGYKRYRPGLHLQSQIPFIPQ